MTTIIESRQSEVGESFALVFGGVDTHQRTHHAAVVDAAGGVVADREFPVTETGYGLLIDWLTAHGLVARVGVESTGSYGAGLTRRLLLAGVDVVEVDRPDTRSRRTDGKSDPLDAIAAARAAASGRAQGLPKLTTGAVEALRVAMIPRDSAVKDRTEALNQLRDLVTTAPAALHDQMITMSGKARVKKAAGFRVDTDHLDDPVQATKRALRVLARRIEALTTEIGEADKIIDRLTTDLVPSLRAMRQIGPHIAAQLAVTAGQNIDRMTTEARFAKLSGVAPLPASSGKRSGRHRINRGGDRQANKALHLIVIGRMKNDPATRDYITRRQADGLSKLDAIRCLKRHLARHTYRALRKDLLDLDEL